MSSKSQPDPASWWISARVHMPPPTGKEAVFPITVVGMPPISRNWAWVLNLWTLAALRYAGSASTGVFILVATGWDCDGRTAWRKVGYVTKICLDWFYRLIVSNFSSTRPKKALKTRHAAKDQTF